MLFIETSIFTKQIKELVSDEEYRQLQQDLLVQPDKGDLIKNGGGIRKVRFAQGNKGKSGGIRVIYYWITEDDQIFFIVLIKHCCPWIQWVSRGGVDTHIDPVVGWQEVLGYTCKDDLWVCSRNLIGIDMVKRKTKLMKEVVKIHSWTMFPRKLE